MLVARKVLAILLFAFILLAWAYMVGWTFPSMTPDYIGSGCFMAVGFLIALSPAYLMWPQRKAAVTTAPSIVRCPTITDQEWKQFVEKYRSEFAESPGME